MMRTIVAVDPTTRMHGLLLEVYPEQDNIASPLLEGLCRRLYERSVRVGLIVARRETAVVRDTLSSLDFTGNRFDVTRLDTAALLQAAHLGKPATGEHFLVQVDRWLAAIGKSWHSVLPQDAIIAMVPDVVGHLVGAMFQTAEDDARLE